MVNFHMGRPYRDSPVVWARLPETFFCMDSLKSPILRKYTHTEPQNRPRSRFWTSHRSQNSNSPVNAASRLHSHAHEGMKMCLIRAATEKDFLFDNIDRLSFIDTPPERHWYFSRLSKRASRQKLLHIPQNYPRTRESSIYSPGLVVTFPLRVVKSCGNSRSRTVRSSSSRSQSDWLLYIFPTIFFPYKQRRCDSQFQ